MFDNVSVYNILLDVVVVVSIIAGTFCASWLKNKAGSELVTRLTKELDLKRDIVNEGILFIQHAYQDSEGPKKYASALEWVSAEFDKRGFEVSEEEIRGLIEASLKSLKLSFKEQWNSAE